LNISQKAELDKVEIDIVSHVKKYGYSPELAYLKQYSQYYVEIEFNEVVIPSIPCSTIKIRRGYDAITEKEFIEIFINDNKIKGKSMSGHSKWANIKHKKAKADAARGVNFAKFSREIIIAAKMGGPDPSVNFRLRTAIDKAKAGGLPNDTIKRAIEKGINTVVFDRGGFIYQGKIAALADAARAAGLEF